MKARWMIAAIAAGVALGAAAMWQYLRPLPLVALDGDTVRHAGQKIRLIGIDAPEIGAAKCAEESTAGRAARDALQAMIAKGTWELRVQPQPDRYGRALAHLFVDGQDVAGALIAAGHARVYNGGKRSGWCGTDSADLTRNR